jgi:hypothetical protein
MKAYVMTSGGVFAFLVLAHLVRVLLEGPRVLTDFWFDFFTVLAAALSLWAWRVLRVARAEGLNVR